MTTNIIVLMFVLSFALYLGTPTHESSLFYDILNSRTTISNQFYLLLIAAGGIGVVAYLFGVSPTYAIFAGITSFLLGFFTLPTAVFASMELPVEIKLLLGGVFGIMYLLSLLSFFKGTEGV